jgi:hypothetical protein
MNGVVFDWLEDALTSEHGRAGHSNADGLPREAQPEYR